MLGATGVFGRLLAERLSTRHRLICAARDHGKLAQLRQSLGVEVRSLDLARPAELLDLARRCFAVICAAGPFQRLDRALPSAVAAEGAHWLDIADDPEWISAQLETAPRAVAILPGLSTIPALSGVLARVGLRRASGDRARVTLFIGNRNAKGSAAIESALRSPLDRPVAIDLPFGRYLAGRFSSADELLLGRELGLQVDSRVAFEMRGGLTLLRWAGRTFGSPRLIRSLAAPLGWLGTDRGCIQLELFKKERPLLKCAFVGRGQSMAILPVCFALDELARGARLARSPAEILPVDAFVACLAAEQIELRVGPCR